VVATDIPGHAAMGAAIDSCVITADDPAEIAAAAERLIDSEQHEVAADSLAAHLWMRENLNLSRWSADLVDRYEQAFGHFAGAPAEPLPLPA
jgi:hypothetical protein